MISADQARQKLQDAGIECFRTYFFNQFHGERLFVARKDWRRAERVVEGATLRRIGGKYCFEFYG